MKFFNCAIAVTGLLLAIIAGVNLLPLNKPTNKPPVTVHPQDLDAITLHAGEMTTGYNSKPVEQLKCIRGDCSKTVTTVQCTNRGLDGERHIQWLCTTLDLPENYNLESLNVNCEGYPTPDSPDIVAGSCGLEYGIKGDGIPDVAFWSLISFTIFLVLITVMCCIACIYYSPAYVYPVGGGYGYSGYPMYGYGGYPYGYGYGAYPMYGPMYGGYGYCGDGFGTGMVTGMMLGGGFGGRGGRSFGGGGSGHQVSSGFSGTHMR